MEMTKMARRGVIKHVQLTETIGLTECTDGFWLYDKTMGMNLAMRVKTPNDAFIEAIKYYQRRFEELDKTYWSLKGRVDSFVAQFDGGNEND